MNKVNCQTVKPKPQRRRSSERGQSAVEFAFVVPVLILLLLAVADFGRVFFVSVAVNNAARAGAQYGSQTVATAQDSSGIQAAASADFGCVASGGASCPNLANWSTPTVSTCTCEAVSGSDNSCPTTGANAYCKHAPQATYVTVTTSATFNTLLPYPGIPSSMTLTGKATMQVEEN